MPADEELEELRALTKVLTELVMEHGGSYRLGDVLASIKDGALCLEWPDGHVLRKPIQQDEPS
jgi:hypothetical protein